ncbi:glycine cleavage system H protein [Salinibacter ruber]|uniref:Glycine cleavage system H protein n=3 Tax=Salinibacter ruber TaxID=146919 RepID=GCSH_SALRD|nr:glycine cleavage system protein GcvH [Salinibacter ruber]Q2S0U9.1 RecName: Full=Glycine cleavage system H protein [Salinibacter ruber DSM 13855]ABC43644.1 glycine cleavage system H protein [Salinibacter ruber DSM 13855]MCS3664745.1 glycine cleavage system H protein [Salinibacter ruber]MCS3829399.1 glycine cleavage system H protein [Salinibacter ruber]MCS3854397.1 glycine cleavage system H protein [Salinibacter ruber]MCS3862432.1 glycine cleavage system H protein [Salinibacter ruber]
MDTPDDLYYTDDHEWLRVENGTATVGITDFAQSELGDIVFVELEPEGTKLGQDDIFGTVEAVKTVSELYMPVGGTITAINTELELSPEVVNEDPYGDGWMIEIELAAPDEAEELMGADAYAEVT